MYKATFSFSNKRIPARIVGSLISGKFNNEAMSRSPNNAWVFSSSA